ncbi:MAG: (Fe-S)-binding protein [Candidatus Freyarchaeota archaeon]|nr:(Fe-S)-binding protein [Candidatus Freyrarchaeum guaymaensis]
MSKLNAYQIYKLLPGTNCKKCGLPNCMVFAVQLLKGEKKPEDCPPLVEDPKYKDKLQQLRELFAPKDAVAETGLIIHPEKCTGCGNCVVGCPAIAAEHPLIGSGKGEIKDDVVFRVEDGKIKVIDLTKCRRYGPIKTCRVCELYCFSGAIELRTV